MFQRLKEALCAAHILAYLQSREKFIVVDKDTSNIGIGGVLSQVQEGQE
jgi:glycine cleavage system pyridoxal-binding protein P